MQTIRLRYVGTSPARRAPHIGLLVRGEWVEVANPLGQELARKLAKDHPKKFELEEAKEAAPKAEPKEKGAKQ